MDIAGTEIYYDSDDTATIDEILDGLEDAITESSISPAPTSITKDTVNDEIVLNFAAATTISEATYKSSVTESYDVAASRIETYKALADKISEIPGLVAYMAKEENGTINDSLEEEDSYSLSTDNIDMYKGIIQIKSLIPGEEFTISEIGEISGSSTTQGQVRTSVYASAGSGTGALESSRDALAELITGKQQDVYAESDLDLDTIVSPATTINYEFNINIYDKEKSTTIPVPNDGSAIPQAAPISFAAGSIDDFVTTINTDANLNKYIEASNLNGNLVITTTDSNYEVDFSTTLKNADNNEPLEKDNDLSGRAGAGAEFIEMVTTVNQTSSQDSLQLRLDTLGISDSAFGEFSVDSSGLITMTQDGAEFAIGQASIALFNNNIGLEANGDNLLAKTTESGEPIYNLNNDKAGTIEGQTLELSTADLSESLVNLMVFQRAFEANAKSITTADEILTTLIGLKR
ncbi:MAG: hypothetical protein CL623_04085 [Arcobacter sp.]|nr:hypothetical protein [Arcobacter sp.]